MKRSDCLLKRHKKSHKLPTQARLSLNGNLLIEHPLTGVHYWFKANGEFLSDFCDYEGLEDELSFPSYVYDMLTFNINTNENNSFIISFPVEGRERNDRRMERDSRRGYSRNIYGRRFRKVENPKSWNCTLIQGWRIYDPKGSFYRRIRVPVP